MRRIYINQIINQFREKFSLPNLTPQQLHACLGKNGVKFENDKKADETTLRYYIYSNDGSSKFYNTYQELYGQPKNKKVNDTQMHNPINKKPEFHNQSELTDMEKASEELLMNQEIGPSRYVGESKKNKRVYITESQYLSLQDKINENKFSVEPQKVKIVANYLDKNFLKGSILKDNGKGMPIVIKKDYNGNPLRKMTAEDLFYELQSQFKNIYDIEQRDKLIKKIIQDWYYDKISKEGLLSSNLY